MGYRLKILVIYFLLLRLSLEKLYVSLERHNGNAGCQTDFEPFVTNFWAMKNDMNYIEIYFYEEK